MMEGARGKRITEKNKEKKRNDEEKKTKSDTTTFSSGSSFSDQTADSLAVVGKSCNIGKSKSHESTYRLHECRSETTLLPIPIDQNLPNEGCIPPHSNLSCASFISAKSDLSNSKPLPKSEQDGENDFSNQDMNEPLSNQQVPMKEQCFEFSSASTEDDFITRLKEMEKKIVGKEKKIKDLSHQIEECNFSKSKKITENRSLTHQVNVLNRQLQSMYELVQEKNWNQKIDPMEYFACKNKTIELQSSIARLEEEREELRGKIDSISSDLESREKELTAKNRELVEYKNRSTLEMCKLMNQTDELKRTIKAQSQVFEARISEAQTGMDDEIVRIATKLEDQYQKDLKSATEKLHSDFERLADLPLSSIERVLRAFEHGEIDWSGLQRDWDEENRSLEDKILSMEARQDSEITRLKDSYETKILFLKTQVETLSAQLRERKEILDTFESELTVYRGRSGMKLPGSNPVDSDEVSSLRELYLSEIRARNQVHRLEANAFENRVKTLSEEILYRARNEENHFEELQNARKMACGYREKYESLVSEWREREEKKIEVFSERDFGAIDLGGIFDQMKDLILSLGKSEEMHEERLRRMKIVHDEEISSYERSMEFFKGKISELELFQIDQLKLDGTIQELIENVGRNYVKTVEALVTSHLTELSLKQLEMLSIEKRYSDEVDLLKRDHQKEIAFLQSELNLIEESKLALEKEFEAMKNENCGEENQNFKRKAEEIAVELLKCEGMMAIKEETEKALKERIDQLENLLRKKEEDCRREREDLTAKLIRVEVISSAKDDLARELEERCAESEILLGKSCREVDNLFSIYSSLEENLRSVSGEELPTSRGDFTRDAELMSKYSLMLGNGEELKVRFLDSFEKIDRLEGERNRLTAAMKEREEMDEEKMRNLERNLISAEAERKEVAEENRKLRMEKKALSESLAEKDRITLEEKERKKEEDCRGKSEELVRSKEREAETRKRLEMVLLEREELMRRGRIVLAEKHEAEERSRVLEEDLKLMNERMDDLIAELKSGNGSHEEGTISISLKEVRLLYEEEEEDEDDETMSSVDRSDSATTMACQVENLKFEELRRENESLREENENLKAELTGRKLMGREGFTRGEEIISRFRRKLSELTSERNGWMKISRSLEREKDCLREEIERLSRENCAIRERLETELRSIEVKSAGSSSPSPEESPSKESNPIEMRKEISQLSNYIKTLSEKLDEMKANNEKLLSESDQRLRNNQSLTHELEEAWVQRYEIEDQLTKVRKENAVLNLHRAQLEDTNRRISNLIAEGKPSVISWIKIHETVETIVDEVLTLKTAFANSAGTTGTSTSTSTTTNPGESDRNWRSQSELKLMTENLHDQLQSKTILCDELLIEKKTLEKEMRSLEELLEKNDSRILTRGRFQESGQEKKRHSEGFGRLEQSRIGSIEEMENPPEECESAVKTGEETQLRTLNLLKKHLENQVDVEEAQFRETLEQKIQGLKKEAENLKESLARRSESLGEAGQEMEEVDQDQEQDQDQDQNQDQDLDLALIERRYEEEVGEAMKEFEERVEKLRRTVFIREGKAEDCEEETKRKFAEEIERTKKYLEEKRTELERKYSEIYGAHNQKRLNSALVKEREQIMNRFREMVRKREMMEEAEETEMEILPEEVLNKYVGGVKSLRTAKPKENFNEHSSEVEISEAVSENRPKVKSKSEEEEEEEEEPGEVKAEGKKLEKGRFSNSTTDSRREKKGKEILEVEKFCGEKLKMWKTKNFSADPSGERNREVEVEVEEEEEEEEGESRKGNPRREAEGDEEIFDKKQRDRG